MAKRKREAIYTEIRKSNEEIKLKHSDPGKVKCLGWCNKEFLSSNKKCIRYCKKCSILKDRIQDQTSLSVYVGS